MSDLGFPHDDALRVVRAALIEDLGGADGVDVTTEATIDASTPVHAQIVARADGVIAGLPVVDLVLRECASITGGGEVGCALVTADGERVLAGAVLAGPAGVRHRAEGIPAQVVCTTGAGDAVAGVLLAMLAAVEFDPSVLPAALDAAMVAGARATESWGALG